MSETTYTPYQASRIVNTRLQEEEIDYQIPPQMMYNYTSGRIRKGQKPLIPSTVTEDGKVRVEREGLMKWLDQYVAKKKATVKS